MEEILPDINPDISCDLPTKIVKLRTRQDLGNNIYVNAI